MGYLFDTSKGETPETIKRQREIVRALMGASRAPQNVGEGLSALGDGIVENVLSHRADAAEKAGMESASAAMGPLAGMFGGGAEAAGGTVAPSSASSGMKGDEIAWKDASPEQRAFLNTLAGPESGGRYNVIYGGGKFDSFADHPRKGVRIQTGPNAGRTSSAAGKYQFLGDTWDAEKNELGLPDFSPENQDKAAWHLAEKTYKRQTGNDLSAVLKSGDPKAIASVGPALRGIWTSLPGGIEQGTNQDKFVSTYQKYLGQGASPAQAQAAAKEAVFVPGVSDAGMSVQPIPNVAPLPQGVDPKILMDPAVQVASLDPAAGVQQAMVEQGQDPNDALSQSLIKLKQNNPDVPVQGAPQAAQPNVIPSGPAQGLPADSPIIRALMGQSGGDPTNPNGQFPAAPPAAQAIPQQLAQAGGEFPAAPPDPNSGDGKIRQLLAAAQNPFLSESQQAIVKALLGEEMQKRDPAYKMGLEKSQIELENLRHPKMTPAQEAELAWKQKEFDAARGDKKAEYDLNVKKFGAEEADRLRQQADREADNARADAAEERQRKEGLTTGNIKDYEAYKRDEVNAGRTPLGRLQYEQELKKAGASQTNVSVDSGMKLTEGQSKDIGYFSRGLAANDALAEREQELTNLGSNLAGKFGVPGNYYKDPKYRQAERDGREVLAVILRKDTGAAVTPDEFETYGQMYLPWPGDDAATVADKREARDRALRGMELGLGTAEPLAKAVREKYAAEKEAKKRKSPAATSKPLSEMSDEELQAIINGQ